MPCECLLKPSPRFLHLLWLVGSQGHWTVDMYIYPSALQPRDDATTCRLYTSRSRKQGPPQVAQWDHTVGPHSEHSGTIHLQQKANGVGVQKAEDEPSCVGRAPALDHGYKLSLLWALG